MQVILLERIEKLGQLGDVVNVRPGYARNFLLPQRKASRATSENMKAFEARKAQLEAENADKRTAAEALAGQMQGLSVVIIRQAGESGALYGSVSARDIAAAVTEQGFAITRQQVQMDIPVKAVGIYDFKVRLHPEVTTTIKVNVAQSADEAEAQAGLAAPDTDTGTADTEGENESGVVFS